ncbi:MAG: sulfite exporter TauE/SafE family protein [Planctomycetes bacterium]|nr:sulfite exporter TauE/SafE family protein [Planctomycetota bacterium]
MISFEHLLPFLTLGLLGAAHCAGMCGGFAVAVSLASGPARWRALRRQLVYVLGKALTYGMLGMLAAQAGTLVVRGGRRLIGEDAAQLAALQYGLAWVAGGMMVLFGLAAIGLGPAFLSGEGLAARLSGDSWWARGARGLQRLFAAVRDLPGDAGALGTGLLTGLLPCGLSWSALALATTTDPLTGFFGLFAFGLATGPVLVLVGLGWHGVSVRFRRLAVGAAGPILIVAGLYTVLRGGVPRSLAAARSQALPACCSEEPESAPSDAPVATDGRAGGE